VSCSGERRISLRATWFGIAGSWRAAAFALAGLIVAAIAAREILMSTLRRPAALVETA